MCNFKESKRLCIFLKNKALIYEGGVVYEGQPQPS
jgi:hypothetical protein